ncbi:hypothetical protein [Xenorhabdus bovienii]
MFYFLAIGLWKKGLSLFIFFHFISYILIVIEDA